MMSLTSFRVNTQDISSVNTFFRSGSSLLGVPFPLPQNRWHTFYTTNTPQSSNFPRIFARKDELLRLGLSWFHVMLGLIFHSVYPLLMGYRVMYPQLNPQADTLNSHLSECDFRSKNVGQRLCVDCAGLLLRLDWNSDVSLETGSFCFIIFIHKDEGPCHTRKGGNRNRVFLREFHIFHESFTWFTESNPQLTRCWCLNKQELAINYDFTTRKKWTLCRILDICRISEI